MASATYKYDTINKPSDFLPMLSDLLLNITPLKFETKQYQDTSGNTYVSSSSSNSSCKSVKKDCPVRGQIPLETYETDDSFVVRLCLPGFEKSDIKVTVKSLQLTVSVSRAEPQVSLHKNFYTEFPYGTLSRTVQLPHFVDTEGSIENSLTNGYLQLIFRKLASEQPRVITL